MAANSQTLLTQRHISPTNNATTTTCINDDMKKKKAMVNSNNSGGDDQWLVSLGDASFMKWTAADIFGVFKYHPVPCVFAASLLFFMGVEYTLRMIPPTAPPFDIGFVATEYLHGILADRPNLNSVLAGLNTVFVLMQTGYILWTWLVEGRPRATIAALFMFTFRGILGYSTQLPLPEEALPKSHHQFLVLVGLILFDSMTVWRPFSHIIWLTYLLRLQFQGFLGSGVDFPVGNVSFFLFYSGHVAASIIASLDMKRMKRWELAFTFDVLNILQIVRLLSTRGHYTIDLAVGVGAGMLFDSMAGNYVTSKRITADVDGMASNTTYGAFFTSSKHENGNGAHY